MHIGKLRGIWPTSEAYTPDEMIPTLLLIGFVGGRWWRITILACTLGWVMVLLAGDPVSSTEALGGGVLAAANTATGVLLYQALALVVARARRR